MTFRIDVPPAVKARIHDCYHHRPEVTLIEMAREVGVTVKTFTAYRRAWGWPDRKQAIFDALQAQIVPRKAVRRKAAAAVTAEGNGSADNALADDDAVPSHSSARGALREAATALARVTRLRLKSLAADRKGSRADPDRTARILADYAKTLTTAQALLRQENEVRDDEGRDDDPRSLHDLHADLARHLERLVAQGEAGGGHGRVVEGGAC